jgi:hypothetical protein
MALSSPMKLILIGGLTLLPAGAVIIYGVSKSTSGGDQERSDNEYTAVDWRTLRGLDLKTGEKSEELKAIASRPVKVPGFVVPLDDDNVSYSEFLLVPSPQACIHVPPPPPNQMILVKMKSGAAPQRSWGPVWVKGTLHVATTDSQYGKISYMLHGEKAEPYRVSTEPPKQLPPP